MGIQPEKKQIKISDEEDIGRAVCKAINLAEMAGFARTAQFMVATAVSELSTNIYYYAKEGEIRLKIIKNAKKKGIEIIALDNGPGIKDVNMAMKENFSSRGSLGLGLPGVKRLMDEFWISSQMGKGTKIIARKWIEVSEKAERKK